MSPFSNDARMDALTPIPGNEIHLWSVDLDSVHLYHCSRSLLSPDEHERALGFRFVIDRKRYTARRGLLRALLGRYLNVNPEAVLLSYGNHGKPALLDGGLHFNLSHSGGQACFALSSECAVGIDIERIRTLPDLLHVAERFCSPSEIALLESMPAAEQTQAFFRCWTRKEALVKGLGQGLSYPVDQISVSFGESAELLDSQIGTGELSQWHFHPWLPGRQFAGAVVSSRQGSRIITHNFTTYQDLLGIERTGMTKETLQP